MLGAILDVLGTQTRLRHGLSFCEDHNLRRKLINAYN